MRFLISTTVLLCAVRICLAAEFEVVTLPAPANDRADAVPAGTPQVLIALKLVQTVNGKEQVLSEPQLAVVSGRTAKLQVGNPPASPNQKFVGTKANIKAIVLDDGRIQAQILLHVANLAGQVREVDVAYVFRDAQRAEITPKDSDVKLFATASIVRSAEAKTPSP